MRELDQDQGQTSGPALLGGGEMVGERRLIVLRDLGAQSIEAKTAEEACAVAAETLAKHPKDIPFALLYLIEPDRHRARLAGAAGIAPASPAGPLIIELGEQAGDQPAWPLAEVVQTETPQTVEDLAGRFGDAVPVGPWSDPPQQAVVVPIRTNIAHQLAGMLVVGISSRLRLDDSYRSFIELAASQIATAISTARAYEDERKRAKTTFFSSDITARKRTEEALQISENRLRLAVEAGVIGIWDIDLRSGVRTWSEQGKAIYGLAAHEPMDYDRQIALIHPDDRARVHAAVTAFRDQGTIKHLELEHRIVRPDGSLCWVAVRGEAIYDGGPLPVRLIGSVIDITERKRVEEALRASEKRYRQLADAMPQLVWTSDPDGTVDYYNSRVAEYAGIVRAEDGGWSWQPVLHPDDLQRTLSAWRAATHRGQLYTCEHRMQMSDGSFRWHLSRALPMYDTGGLIIKWFGTATDIHEQKQAEQASRFLAEMGEIIRLATDPEEVLEKMAQAVAEHVQVRRCLFIEIDQEHDRGVVRSEYCRGVPSVAREYKISDYSSVAQTEIAVGRTIINHDSQTDPRTAASYEASYRPNGERAYVAVPLMRNGRWNGTLWVSDDRPRQWELNEITLLETVAERVWLAIEKLRVEQALREAVRIRDVFLSVASHELKTPLTSLLGNAQLLQRWAKREGGFSERARRAIDVIADQASRLNKMIAMLLDISRIETGQLTIERAPLDLVALVRRVVIEIQPATDKHPILLEVADEKLLVEGDELRLEQVIQNLIGNAIKYSPQGGSISVRIQRQGDGTSVAVTDTGIGIPQAAIPRLFQRFYRARNVEAQHISGMGIGLFVVKDIMALHGGTIEIESSEGIGSTFTIWLPLAE